MQIIVAGCGTVGNALINQLTSEDHNITVIDPDATRVKEAVDMYDVMGIVGNAASYSTMSDAGIEEADLMIAVTDSDELNLLCCLIANKAGNCHTVARVRNPVYKQEVGYIKEELGLSMVINPEEAAAEEAVRLLKFPFARRVETFARGKVEMVTVLIEAGNALIGRKLTDIRQEMRTSVLFCVVVRAGETIIPDGHFIPLANDEITLIGRNKAMVDFFKRLKFPTSRVHSAMVVGGGAVTYYLAKQLITLGADVRIFEKDKARAKTLSSEIPEALIINASGIDRDMLMEEGLANVEAFLALTDHDEENIMLSLYAGTVSKSKRVTLVHHVQYNDLVDTLNVGSIIDPREITAEMITQFVRGMSNSMGSNIEALHSINDGQAEVMEFLVAENAPVIGIPLAKLDIKKGSLVVAVIRGQETISPSGTTVIKAKDRVIAVTRDTGFTDIGDILAKS